MNNLELELEYIKMEIENTRTKLNGLISRKIENILDPEVIKLSQELDELLVRYLNKDFNDYFLVLN